MIAALRTACASTLRTAPRLTPRMHVRTFRMTPLSAAVQKYFTAEHEWLKYDDSKNVGTLGITDHAQNSLGDVVFLELPAMELEVSQGGAYTCRRC